MNKNEQKIYELALAVIHGRLTIIEFSLMINKSYRQCQRIIKKIEDKGMLGVKHGNTGRVPINKTSSEKEMDVLGLLKGKYYDFNLTHFKEMIQEHEGIEIGKNIIHRIATQHNLVKRPKKRPRHRVHKPRPRMPEKGMLVQFDGSEHTWFGNIESDLIGGIDDATGKVLGAEFFIGETSLHCMKVMKDIVVAYGIPQAFYLDQAGYFGKDDREQSTTQIGRALEELNCNIILANSPQAKGRIERLWNTFQDRLIAELRLNNIKTIPRANEFLKNDFIPRYNKKFSVHPRSTVSGFTPLSEELDLNKVFCTKEKRKISQGNIFSWAGTKYILNETKNYRFRTINICVHYEGHVTFDIMGKQVSVIEYIPEKRVDFIAA